MTDPALLLELTKRSATLTKSLLPWRSLVETTEDHVLLHIVRLCEENVLVDIAYYAVVLNRHQFLTWWWSRKALPQIKNATNWYSIIMGLHTYRLNINKNPLQIMLTIFRSKPLRLLYPDMLTLNSNNYDKIENINSHNELYMLRMLLVDMASAIPNGTILLYTEWKKYSYNIDSVWNFNIPCVFSVTDLEVLIDYSSMDHTPPQHICRYGNLKDFKIVIKNPAWLQNNKHPLVSIVQNKNNAVFRYFMETIWTMQKFCMLFPEHISEKIWDNCFLKNIINIDAISKSLIILSKRKVKNWRYRIIMLQWLCQECTPDLLAKCIDKQDILNINPRLYNCTFNYFVKTRPVHPNPEDILWVETQTPLISPKADGLYYYGILPDCLPTVVINPLVQAEHIQLGWCDFYMVFDVNVLGRWDYRVHQYASNHSYWKGPYLSVDDENKDLQLFLDLAKINEWKKIWWPKGVYAGIKGPRFFELLTNPPNTPYPNDGWVVAGSKGPFWKIKPTEHLTLDIKYENERWYLKNGVVYNDVITEFPYIPEPINIPARVITAFVKQVFKDMNGLCDPSSLDIILSLLVYNITLLQNNTTLHDIIKEKISPIRHKNNYKALYTRYKWLLSDTLTLPRDWVHDYKGGPIYDGVWRCEWDSDNQKWRPISRRFDKEEGNDTSIETLLTGQHKHSWTCIDLLPFYNNRPYYNTRSAKNREIKLLHSNQKKDINEFCEEHNINLNTCSSLAGGYKNASEIYELDPYIVADRNWFKGNRWLWADASNLKNPVTNEQFKLYSSSLCIQNAIHYFAKDRETWIQFLDTVNLSRSLFITMIDANVLFKIRDTFTMPDGSYMKKCTQDWHNGVWKGESLLKWNGSTIHKEPFISSTFVKQELLAQGWKLHASSQTELGVLIMFFKK